MRPLVVFVLLVLVHVAVARYFRRPARYQDGITRDLPRIIRDLPRADDYGFLLDDTPTVKAVSGLTCQTTCRMSVFSRHYECKTSGNERDPCSPKGYAITGQECQQARRFPCGQYGRSECYVRSGNSYRREKCSIYQ